MLEFAEFNFKLNTPDKNGTTQREHLEQVERQTGRRPIALEGPDFPMLVSHIWSAFILLSSARSAGFSGPNPISYEEIKTWKELTETPLDAREVEAIKRLDTVYMRVMNG
jgi:hypothetical protein